MNWSFIIIVVLVLAMLFGIWAQFAVMKRFTIALKTVNKSSNITASQLALRMLKDNGIYDVGITQANGRLIDNFNPISKTVTLSKDVYNSSSVGALAIAAHEVGHVIQYAKKMKLMKFRTSLVPITSFANHLVWPILIIAFLSILLFHQFTIGYIFVGLGAAVFSILALFALVTYPIEVDASRRGLKYLAENKIVQNEDYHIAEQLLKAASYTYLANLISTLAVALMWILYFFSQSR
ncbi:zinc metallopeptidase [Mycoplasma sp. SG1]|uniref:zinc metallopeptidase n=1 Tax=Mycoplasma sp. SG1 TaxID=2810348 RepID=UPI002024C419|nr:zinc metallopeptidase [Mycoplasma sp. SG1]URM53122.1 zinc metallopeptidase [Mycoplasma sp. SG1]